MYPAKTKQRGFMHFFKFVHLLFYKGINGSVYDKKCNMTELGNQACFGYLYVRILNYKNIESTGDPYIIQKNIRNFKKEG